MSSSNLVRVGGLAAVAAGALWLIADLWGLVQEFLLGGSSEKYSEVATTTTYMVTSAGYLIGGLLVLVALVGLYTRQAEAAGMLGLIGFLAALVGTALAVGAFWTFAFVAPSAAIEAPAFLDAEQVGGPLDAGIMLSFGCLAVGWALFGVATFRARAFPRVAAIVLTVGALLSFAPLPASTIVLELAVAWLGLIVLREHAPSAGRVEAGAQPRVQ